VLGLVWWILALPRTDAWGAGALALLVGAGLHAALGGRSGARLHPAGLVAFVPFFLDQSFRGGFDVARRALSPSLPVAPAFLDYRTRLPEGPTQVFFVNCVSLLPGTFSARFQEGELRVHLLTDDGSGPERLKRLEEKVAGLFGVGLELPPREGEGAVE
jgi:multicomponent Na+:H+ antiporter subunit E